MAQTTFGFFSPFSVQSYPEYACFRLHTAVAMDSRDVDLEKYFNPAPLVCEPSLHASFGIADSL